MYKIWFGTAVSNLKSIVELIINSRFESVFVQTSYVNLYGDLLKIQYLVKNTLHCFYMAPLLHVQCECALLAIRQVTVISVEWYNARGS